MDKSKPPTTFGVFKPTGHTLIAFHTHEELRTAMTELARRGFAGSAMVQYSAEEMRQQADAQLAAPSPMANFGYEIDLLRAHRALAQEGCDFLIVKTPSQAHADTISAMLQQMKPAAAQHYGRFLIQDLTESPPVQ